MTVIGGNFEGPGIEAFKLQRSLIVDILTRPAIEIPTYHVDPYSKAEVERTRAFLPKKKGYLPEK